MAGSPPQDMLNRIADAYGVATHYWSFAGEYVTVDADTLVAVLAAMGIDTSTPEAAQAALDTVDSREWRHVLPATTVVREGNEQIIRVHVPHGAAVALTYELEDGTELPAVQAEDFELPRLIDGAMIGRAAFIIPGNLPLGYHTVRAKVTPPAAGEEAATWHSGALIVVPARLPAPAEKGVAGWGVMSQLYSVRSRDSWGTGDTADLAELGSLFGGLGAQFVLINPLHAAEPCGQLTNSPYLPTSRRFFNPLYIRPEDIREVAYMDSGKRSMVTWAGQAPKESSLHNTLLDRSACWEAKRSALEVIYREPRSHARQADFDAFRAAEGQGLEDFAFWCAMYERYGKHFPVECERPDTLASRRERAELSERIDFYCWCQWVMDQQLEAAQKVARDAGMGIGVVHDLAVGVQACGADAWANPDAFASGVSVGSPPDMYNQLGQDWSPPPFNPVELDRQHYAPVRDMARTVMRHAGALRIDHVMGFFRLWWIPAGNKPVDGTYVYYNHEALIGVLMLEAARSGTFLIGEDLGNVEPWVRDFLTERGIFGTSVMLFEKEGEAFRAPEHYRSASLVTVDTHDLPPLAGYLAGEHVDLRASLDILVEPVEQVREEARRERSVLIDTLCGCGLLESHDPTERELIEAMHCYIARTPAQLQAIALVDAVGERRTQNQPGTDTEYPNWKIPLADGTEKVVLTEDLGEHPRLRSLIAALTAEYERCHPRG
ncbi:4-alpha-glucanotransferase [Actinotignum timonense]